MKEQFWGWTILALVGIGTLAIAAAFAFDFQGVSGFLWELPVLFMASATIGAAALALGIQQSARPRLVKLTVVAAGIIWVLFVLGLFNFELPGAPESWLRRGEEVGVLVICVFGFLMAALLPLLALEARTRTMRILRRAALISCIALAGIWTVYYINDQYFSWATQFGRGVLMFASIAAMASVLLLPGGLFLSRSAHQPQPIRIAQLLCPRCGSACDTAGVDECTCAQCQLPIHLERREPRCACGYLLVNLDGTTCPECGKHFAARIRYELTSA